MLFRPSCRRLKKRVSKFILKHRKAVVTTEAWKRMKAAHPGERYNVRTHSFTRAMCLFAPSELVVEVMEFPEG